MAMQRVIIYTDGACRGNPGPGGWAVVLIYGRARKTLCGSARSTTNNRMELLAAIQALDALKRPCAVELLTDSQYVRDGMETWLSRWKARGFRTLGGQPVKNQDLWQALDKAASRHEIRWKWIRGHSGDPVNELCDKLANEALDGGFNPSDKTAAVPPIRTETRTFMLGDGRSQVVQVKVYPAAWAKGATRQTIGRLRRRRSLRGKMK